MKLFARHMVSSYNAIVPFDTFGREMCRNYLYKHHRWERGIVMCKLSDVPDRRTYEPANGWCIMAYPNKKGLT